MQEAELMNGIKVKRKVVTVGTSKAVTVPHIIFEHYNLAEKIFTHVHVTFDAGNNRLIIEPIFHK